MVLEKNKIKNKKIINKPDNSKIAYEPGYEKMCLMSYANNKGAEQPAHPRSLINAIVIRCLDSMILSRFYSRNFKTLASFCGCAGSFVSGLVGNSRRHILSCRGSYEFVQFARIEKCTRSSELNWLNDVFLSWRF